MIEEITVVTHKHEPLKLTNTGKVLIGITGKEISKIYIIISITEDNLFRPRVNLFCHICSLYILSNLAAGLGFQNQQLVINLNEKT